jgi:hypothetical protein
VIAKFLSVSAILAATILAASAHAEGFGLRAKTKIGYGMVVYSKGYAYGFDEFNSYGINALTARCLAWPGVAGQIDTRSGGTIQPGELITVAIDAASGSRTMVFRLSRADGRQFGGLTCDVSRNAATPATDNDVKNFLQTQFGTSAEIN